MNTVRVDSPGSFNSYMGSSEGSVHVYRCTKFSYKSINLETLLKGIILHCFSELVTECTCMERSMVL